MKKLILIFTTAFCFAAQAQEIQKPYIEVTGTSEIEVIPDEITITITLQESKERASISKQEDRLKKAMSDLGINLTNLTLNSADADFQKVKVLKKETMISKTYLLKLNNAEMVSRVYEKLSELDAQDAYISKVNHSKIEELKKENGLKALKAAKEKAQNLLAAIGQQTGMPLQIYEQQNGIVNPVAPMYRNVKLATFDSMASSSDESEISFRKIKIVSSFLVRYEIK